MVWQIEHSVHVADDQYIGSVCDTVGSVVFPKVFHIGFCEPLVQAVGLLPL